MIRARQAWRRGWRWPVLLLALAAGRAPAAAPAAPAVEFTWVAEDRDVDLLAFRGELYFTRGQYAEARRCFKSIMRRSHTLQNRASAALGLGMGLWAQGDYGDAAAELMSTVDAYAPYLPFALVVETEFDIAVQHLDGQRYFFGLFSRNPQAAKIYDHLQRVAAYLPVGALATYRRSLISDGDADDESGSDHPVNRCETFLARYPEHALAPEVRLRLIAELLARAARHGDLLLVDRARHELDLLKTLPPDAGREAAAARLARQADDIAADKLLELAEFYLLPAEYRPGAARRYVDDLLRRYGDRPAAARGRDLLARLRDVKPDYPTAPEAP